MIKYEINLLHKYAQMGKECCEHLLKYAKDENIKKTIEQQLKAYEDIMYEFENIYYDLEDIGRLQSICFSMMLKMNLKLNHSNAALIKNLVKGNIMGLESVTNFIHCPYNSKKSKVYASKLLQVINQNLKELMENYIYSKDFV